MIELKFLKDLPINILGRDDVEINGVRIGRSYVAARYCQSPVDNYDLIQIAPWYGGGDVQTNTLVVANREQWKDILDRMDNYKLPEPKPCWEPGTVLYRISDPYTPTCRLDRFLGNTEQGEEKWSYRILFSAIDSFSHTAAFSPSIWSIRRCPHQFEIGDWAEDRKRNNEVFRVDGVSSPYLYSKHDAHSTSTHWASDCYHAAPPAAPPAAVKPVEEKVRCKCGCTTCICTGTVYCCPDCKRIFMHGE